MKGLMRYNTELRMHCWCTSKEDFFSFFIAGENVQAIPLRRLSFLIRINFWEMSADSNPECYSAANLAIHLLQDSALFYGTNRQPCFQRPNSWTEIQTKLLRVFLHAIHSHLYSFALRFYFFKLTQPLTVSWVHHKGEGRKTWIVNHTPYPMVWKSTQKSQVWELSRWCPETETSTILYVHEFGFWSFLPIFKHPHIFSTTL